MITRSSPIITGGTRAGRNLPLTLRPPLRIIPALHLTVKKPGKRGIAQSGSAPALGAGCRGFESLYPDQITRPRRSDMRP